MPSFSEHVRLSIVRTGKSHLALHEWMDGRSTRVRDVIARHNFVNLPGLLPVVEKKFGRDGVREFLRHLEDDYRTHLVLKIWKKVAETRGATPLRDLLRPLRGES